MDDLPENKEEDINNESFKKINNNYTNNKSNIDLIQNGNEENQEIEGGEEEEEEDEEEKEEIEPSKEIELLYESLLEFYSKKQFKKILKTIVLKADKEEKFNLLEWKLLHLRTLTLLMILNKKNSNYHKSGKFPHFSEYIQKINNDINNWILFTEELKSQNKIIYIEPFNEFIIFFILEKINILSKNAIYSGHVKDAIAILSLGIKFINKVFHFFKSPNSYSLASEIFLSLSSLMMAEEKLDTAKTFITISLKFSFLCLEIKLFKNGINYKVFNLLDYRNELSHFSKIFFNLSLAFYQLGTCYEKEGYPYDSYFAMKTARFFGNIIENENIERFINKIKDIEIRLLMRNRIILFFEKNVKKEEMDEKIIKIKKVYNKLYDQEERRKHRFKDIKSFLSKLRLADIDDDEPDLFNKVGCKPLKENILKTTKQLHLLNFLMSNDFREVINKMNKLEINKLEKDTINKIQKKIISLKNNEHAKLELKKKKEKVYIKKSYETFKEKNKEKEDKIMKSQNFSNTIKSTSNYSLTTVTTRKPRIHSAFKMMNKKKLLNNKENQSNKTLRTYVERPAITESLYTSPSRFVSLTENYNYSSNINYNIYSRDKIINSKKNINKSNTQRVYKQKIHKIPKNIFKYKPNYIPQYNYNHFYFNKKYIKRYNFLESQFDREIDFQKELLKTKFIKEETFPEPFDIRDIHKKVDEIYYTTFENELMNAKEKQIIFDKNELLNSTKGRVKRRNYSSAQKIFNYVNYKKEKIEKNYLNKNQIREMNEDYINDITNKISKIASQEKNILRKKRKILK